MLLASQIPAAPLPIDAVTALGRRIAQALTIVPHGELAPELIEVGSDRVTILPPAGDRARYGWYASPERAMNQPITTAADVFSLAAILFHLLTGRPPFRGSSAMEVMLATMTDAPAELLSLRRDAPPALASLLARTLARDPSQRPQSGAEFADALATVAVPVVDAWPGKRLLIADDDEAIRNMVAYVAARVGVQFDVVATGREAIDALKARRYAVALLDLNMPRLDGWGVLDFLKLRPAQKPQHLFIVTGFRDQAMTGVESLVDDVLYKPVPPDVLRELLMRCLA